MLNIREHIRTHDFGEHIPKCSNTYMFSNTWSNHMCSTYVLECMLKELHDDAHVPNITTLLTLTTFEPASTLLHSESLSDREALTWSRGGGYGDHDGERNTPVHSALGGHYCSTNSRCLSTFPSLPSVTSEFHKSLGCAPTTPFSTTSTTASSVFTVGAASGGSAPNATTAYPHTTFVKRTVSE